MTTYGINSQNNMYLNFFTFWQEEANQMERYLASEFKKTEGIQESIKQKELI